MGRISKLGTSSKKPNSSIFAFFKQAGHFLVQKVITQPCCWLSFIPAARAFFFAEHNPLLELGIGALLIISVVEGGHLINHLRNKSTNCSRLISYSTAIAFYMVAFLIAHIYFPH